MSMASIDGREWAVLSELTAGMLLEFDDGFDCGIAERVIAVEVDDCGEFYVPCLSGRHYLDGQVSDEDGDHLVGVWVKD